MQRAWTVGREQRLLTGEEVSKFSFPHNPVHFNIHVSLMQIAPGLSLLWLLVLAFRRPRKSPVSTFRTVFYLYPTSRKQAKEANKPQTPPTQHKKLQPLGLNYHSGHVSPLKPDQKVFVQKLLVQVNL